MSFTYHLVCRDCKVTLWVGQGWPPDRVYLYTTEKAIKLLNDLLFGHQLHHLEFGESQMMDDEDYTDLDPDDEV